MSNAYRVAVRIAATVVASTLLIYGLAFGQPASVTLNGRVTDPEGLPLPAATVTVRRLATSAVWTLASDEQGRFAMPMLPPGLFEVDVSMDGFTSWSQRDVTLAVGQTRHLEIRLSVAQVQERVDVLGETDRPSFTPVVEGVMPSAQIQMMPLNGRNFLELALLVAGNQPAPAFDPTKTNTVLVASAGQLGRGGNVAVDGQDNNDDLVGGPLLNLPIDAVQEFQIATNRFSSDVGRSASSVINIVTRSGGNTPRGVAAIFARDGAWQGLPATVDRREGYPPFDRQQTSAALGGPIQRNIAFWFGALEYRNQDGAVLVGSRDLLTRTIRRGFAPAPLDDWLWSGRLDAGRAGNRLMLRYAGERALDTAASALERTIGSAAQRQTALNRHHHVLASWTTMPTGAMVNATDISVSAFSNRTLPAVDASPQLTFPSIQDGASFRMPQETTQRRLQASHTTSIVRGAHLFRFGGQTHIVKGSFRLGVLQHGRVEFTQDFPSIDHNGDGVVDDNDLLFGVTLRSGRRDGPVLLPDVDNVHLAGFVHDDWRASAGFQLQGGVRYEFDTNVNNHSHTSELNPLVRHFMTGDRKRDGNNVAPRIGFVWTPGAGRTMLRGGYGIYYDRIVLQVPSLERVLDGRRLPIEVRAGNVSSIDPDTGRFRHGAPTLAAPFTGAIVPGAGASGITLLDSRLQNPTVHQFHLGLDRDWLGGRIRADLVHNQGTHFLIGRTVGEVFNPVIDGVERVVNIESSARTKYTALLLSGDKQFSPQAGVRVAYTLSKALNYANDDQLPFLNGPIDPNNLRRERGPPPNDRRHRLVVSARARMPWGLDVAGIWTLSSGVPMDIMMPDGSTRIPVLQRNAGGRVFADAQSLNAYLTSLNGTGGVKGVLLPLVRDDAKFNDGFNSLDLRLSRPFRLAGNVFLEPMLECFNVFNVTNILGTTNLNYSGFSNVLVRDSEDPAAPGYLTSRSFGRPMTTAGGIFGTGGPRAVQVAARLTF